MTTTTDHVLYIHTSGLRASDAEVVDYDGTLAECRAELARAPEAYAFFCLGVIVNAKTRETIDTVEAWQVARKEA